MGQFLSASCRSILPFLFGGELHEGWSCHFRAPMLTEPPAPWFLKRKPLLFIACSQFTPLFGPGTRSPRIVLHPGHGHLPAVPSPRDGSLRCLVPGSGSPATDVGFPTHGSSTTGVPHSGRGRKRETQGATSTQVFPWFTFLPMETAYQLLGLGGRKRVHLPLSRAATVCP